jgi:hypothetical protein
MLFWKKEIKQKDNQYQTINTMNILRIDTNGNLVKLNKSLNRWELTSMAWSWRDISKGFKRESKANYKRANK